MSNNRTVVAEKMSGRKLERRQGLMEAALKVFLRDGFAAATVDDIAREANIAKGTVYIYFKSKEELFEAAVKAKMFPVLERLISMPDSFDGSALDLLRIQMRYVYRYLCSEEKSEIMRLLISEGPNFPEMVQFYYSTLAVDVIHILNKTIAYGVKKGEFRDAVSKDLPMMIISPGLFAGLWGLLFKETHKIDYEAYFETYMDHMLYGLLIREEADNIA